MDLTDPTRAVTSTLDGPVLAVLAQAGRPLTVGEVAGQAVRGSEIGIRKSLARLVGQGIVRATEMGRNRVHELNREHVSAPIAELLAGLRLELWTRFRQSFETWKPPPLYACVFGSAARGDGGPDSDIDLLLVHRTFPTDKRPRGAKSGRAEVTDELALASTVTPMTEAEVAAWREQVDELRRVVHRWTGNPLQAVDLSAFEWADHSRRKTALFDEIGRDGVVLVRPQTQLPSSQTGGKS